MVSAGGTSLNCPTKLCDACPVYTSPHRSPYINSALLLWSIRIVERPDAPIDVNAFTDSLISCPVLFKADFVPTMKEDRFREMMREGM
jgi:hypothetical protein